MVKYFLQPSSCVPSTRSLLFSCFPLLCFFQLQPYRKHLIKRFSTSTELCLVCVCNDLGMVAMNVEDIVKFNERHQVKKDMLIVLDLRRTLYSSLLTTYFIIHTNNGMLVFLAIELHEVFWKWILNKLLLVASLLSKDLYRSCHDDNLPELSGDPTKAKTKVINNSHSTSEVSEILHNKNISIFYKM